MIPEAKVYLQSSRTSATEFFQEYPFFYKIYKKTIVPEFFNKVAGNYPATSLKERTPTQVFSDEFCKILNTPFVKPHSHLLIFPRKTLRQVLRTCLRTNCFLRKDLLIFAYFCT